MQKLTWLSRLAVLWLLASVSFTAAAAKAEDDYTQTRYPIVLAHGLYGFKTLLGFVDYWPAMEEALEHSGAEVYITEVSPLNDSYVRGEQLLAQLLELQAIHGMEKFNLIGHSQGTLDIRYVAGVRPDLVASITAIAGPHDPGFADAAPFGFDNKFILLGFKLMGNFITALRGSDMARDENAFAQFMSNEGLSEFNRLFPHGLVENYCGDGDELIEIDGHQIAAYSWSGVAQKTHRWDFSDLIMAVGGNMVGSDSDGLVGRCASHFGKVIKDDYYHNHLDEVNLMFGLVPRKEIHPAVLYRAHANRLKNAGL